MSSSSSSSSSSRSTPEPVPKRKREEADADDSDAESDSSSDSDSDSDAEPEVPVLSHAEQRRQKRREKQAAKEKDSEPSTKKRKLPDGTASAAGAPAKRQNSVWVGNLTFKTTTEALTEFFKDAGVITRIHMPTKVSIAPGVKAENRGYAYVDFTTPEGKTAAIALSEQNLFGRRLLIKDGGDFTGRPAVPGADATATAAANGSEPPKTHSKTAQKILRAQKQPPAPTLFLGNLGFETTDASIRELFDAHRPVKKKPAPKPEDDTEEGEDAKPKPQTADTEKWIRKVRMGTFEDSGLCKGFAFVDFTSIEHATSVLVNTKNHTLNGRKLVVEYASPDAVRRGAPKTKREDGGAEKPQRRTFKEAKSRGPRAEKKLERAKNVTEEGPTTFSRPSRDYTAPTPHDAAETGGDGRRERKGPKNRPKPGAALALAKRESAAIVPSQGKKVVF